MSGLLPGSLGASRIADATARKKGGGWGASRENIMAEIICERLTGQPYETYESPAMRWGIDKEAAACGAYEFKTGNAVVKFETVSIPHPKIRGSHASPDGVIDVDGLIEIKCPNTATHIATLRADKVDKRYEKQIQWQLACTGRAWCDWVSYDPRLPLSMQLYIRRVERDDVFIADLEEEVIAFLIELENEEQALRTKYELKQTLEASAA